MTHAQYIAEHRAFPGPENGNPAKVTVDVVTSFDSGGITGAEWNSLVDRCDASVYSTWEWQSLWWEHLGSRKRGRTLNILVFRLGERVVGIGPFFRDPTGFSGRSMLRFLGSGEAFGMSGGMFLDDGPSDYLDIIAEPDSARAVAAEFAAYLLRNHGTLDGCEMVNLPPGGIASTFALSEVGRLGFTIDSSPGDVCPWIAVVSGTEEFIGGMGASLRRRLNQAYRLLGDGSTTYAENQTGDWDNFFDSLAHLHQKRWNSAGFPGLFHDEESRRFQKAVAERFMQHGWLWTASLHEDGRCVAARMGFNFRGRMYDYLSGFDESAASARRRPGTALLLAMHRAAHASGSGILDMLRGDEKYKFELTSRSVNLLNVSILQPARPDGELRRGAVRIGRIVRFMLGREVRLLEVQHRMGGFPGGLLRYFSFRVLRLRRKISLSGDAEPGQSVGKKPRSTLHNTATDHDQHHGRTGHMTGTPGAESGSATRTSVPALVIGGIGIVRNLGEEGIPVYAGSDIPQNHILYSKFVDRKVFFAKMYGEGFVTQLISLAKTEGRKLMFFSDDDRAILTFSQHQEELRPYYHFTFPPAKMVDAILDKRKFAELARELDLPVPWSLSPGSMEELESLLPEVTYPCIIKPAHKDDWWTPKFARLLGAYKKAIECHSREELLDVFPKVLQVSPNPLLQELVEGDDSQLYSINMYFDRDSNLKGYYTAHKYRTYPIHAGQGCFVETVRDEEILRVSMETAEKLHMVGLCNMQYKRDKNGLLKIMELHIRNSVWSYLGKASGMNLYYYAYLDQQGYPYPYPNDYETGVKFLDLKRDTKALFAYRKTGEWTLWQGIRTWRGKKIFHIFHPRDPLPFFADAWFEFRQRYFKRPGGGDQSNLDPTGTAERDKQSVESRP